MDIVPWGRVPRFLRDILEEFQPRTIEEAQDFLYFLVSHAIGMIAEVEVDTYSDIPDHRSDKSWALYAEMVKLISFRKQLNALKLPR